MKKKKKKKSDHFVRLQILPPETMYIKLFKAVQFKQFQSKPFETVEIIVSDSAN